MKRKIKLHLRRLLVSPKMLGSIILSFCLGNIGIIDAQNNIPMNSDLKVNSKEAVVKDSIKSYENEKVYDGYEQNPQFPGGDKALLDFIYKNLKYPESAIKADIQGKVMLRFVITITGEVDKVEIIRSLQPDCDKEAIRVVKMLPKFIPGKYRGKPESRWYILPVTFKLPNAKPLNPKVVQTEGLDSVYTVTDQAPEFPGGFVELLNFIRKNLNRPPIGPFENDLFYKVMCRFVVEKNGNVSNITVVRSLSPWYDEEAVKVLKLLPKFIPGKYKGQTVRAYYNVPVSFRLE